jgi:hypothetical protein
LKSNFHSHTPLNGGGGSGTSRRATLKGTRKKGLRLATNHQTALYNGRGKTNTIQEKLGVVELCIDT